MAPRRVLISTKIDLDTVGVGFLLGINREDNVEVVRGGKASDDDLANSEILCIEVGGRARVAEGNFDHHGSTPLGYPEEDVHTQLSATLQAAKYRMGKVIKKPPCGKGYDFKYFSCRRCNFPEVREEMNASLSEMGLGPWNEELQLKICLVRYIDLLDRFGPESLRASRREEVFPALSDVFAGMILTTREPVEQFHQGVKMLQEVVHRGIHSFGRMPVEEIHEWTTYAETKAENNRQVAKAMESAQWGTTASGRKLGYLETNFFGAPGALYGRGAEIVVAFAPQFGNPPVPKFTVAGNGIRVDMVLQRLNELEPGWGGPPTGTIIGSPREGSRLSLEEVVAVVKETL